MLMPGRHPIGPYAFLSPTNQTSKLKQHNVTLAERQQTSTGRRGRFC